MFLLKKTHNLDNVKPCCYSRTHLFVVTKVKKKLARKIEKAQQIQKEAKLQAAFKIRASQGRAGLRRTDRLT
jgi:hypothetical protein